MNIRYALESDIDILIKYDTHIKKEVLKECILLKRVYIMEENNNLIGILRYNLFWDNTPFLNLLFILEQYRNHKYGMYLMNYYENEMKKLGYSYLLLSTPSNETSKFFYQKLNYQEIGSLKYLNDPLEIVMAKHI